MPTSTMITLGLPGWLTLLSTIVGALVRLIKTDAVDSFLTNLGFPSIPKKALPWIAMFLGLAGGFLDGLINGESWQQALVAGLWGLVSGGGAIAGNELLSPATRKVLGDGPANMMFGKKKDTETMKKSGTSVPPLAVLAFLLVGALALPGCAALAAAGPVISDIAVAVADGEQVIAIIESVEHAYFAAKPDAVMQQKIENDLTKAHIALDLALRADKGVGDLTSKDVSAAIGDFESAYGDLLLLLSQAGIQTSASPLAKVGPSAKPVVVIPRPMILSLAKSSK